MRRNELASDYLSRYEDTDVTIIDATTFDVSGYGESDYSNPVAFDLSDGTHWFSDVNSTAQVAESLTDCTIVYNGDYGWVVVNEDGTESDIDWL